MAITKEEQAVSAEIYYKSIVETVREPLLVLDGQLRVISANRAFYRLFQVSPGETEHKHIYELGSGQWKLDGLRDLLEKVIPANEQFQDYEIDYDFPVIGHRTMLLNGRRINQGEGREQHILLAIEDITEHKRKDTILSETLRLVDNSPDIVARFDREGRYRYVNRALEQHIRKPKEEIIGKTLVEVGIPPKTAAVFEGAFNRALKTNKQEVIVVPLGGRLYQVFIVPETDRTGDIVSFAGYARDVTDIRRAEAELRSSEAVLNAFFENSPVALGIFEEGMKFVKVDRNTAQRFFGKDPAQVVGKSLGDIEPETAKRTEPLVREVLEKGKAVNFEGFFADSRGQNHYLVASGFPLRLAAGKRGVGSVAIDITERKEAEEALRESEEKYRALVERANDGIIIVQDGIITFANSKMAELDGSSVRELVGTHYTEHVYPSEIPRLIEIYRRRMAGEKLPASYETILRRRNGERTPAEISAAVTMYRGRPADLVVVHDISAYKRTEAELQQRETEFRTLAENSPDIIVRYDRNGRFLYANPKAETIFHHPRAEIIGKNNIELGMPKQGADFWESLIREVFAEKKEKTVGFDFPPGERYFETYLVPEFDEKGNMTSVLSISRDITEMKKTEETLRRNEYELRTLVDNSPDLVFRVSRNMRYEYVNSAYERLTGISKEQFIGKTNEELGMPPQLAGFWQQALTRVIGGGREYAIEFEIAGIFGKRYFTTRLIPEFLKTGDVGTVLAIARDITERMHAEEQLRYVSFHDKVTGLFNRAFFEEEIRRIDSERELPISIIMGDVNNLKLINDVFGHGEGDKLLKAIADSIKKACRNTDIVARWGGDEFAVILPKTDAATARAVCSRINQIAGESKGTVIRPSIAVGIAAKEKRDQNIYRTVRQAEQGMYDDKLMNSVQIEKAVIASLRARAEERMENLTEHVVRAQALALPFGQALGLDEDQMKNLFHLIELHDIGTAVIPREVLAKPGRLTQEEWEQVKRHPEAGYRITKSFPDTARIADEILSHDEHWDGSGYPRGLKGKDIPYLSRAFALIEAYDVMTHPRPYAPTLTPYEAAEELRRNAGKQFDPELTEVFTTRVAQKHAEPAKA